MGHQVHLTLHEREDIMLMRRDGRGVSEIARAIRRSKSTVSRELKRNSCERFYRASTAQRRYAERRKACRRRRVLDDERVFSLVRDKFLEEQWSPERIEGRLALELGASPVSDTTTYRGIHAGRFDGRIGARKAKWRLRHRGKEFANHARVTADIGVEFYFALPHHPWQRGTNENANGLLRERFPKGESPARVSEKRVQEVYDKLNRRPRKRLGYRTPYEVHCSEVLHLI